MIKLGNLCIFRHRSQKYRLLRPPKIRRICMRKTESFHPVTFEWCSIQILVISQIFKLSLNLSLTHLRVKLPELKGDLSPVMLKEIFRDSFEKFEIYKNLYGKPCKHDWVAKLFFSYKYASNLRRAAVTIATSEIYE